MLHTLYPPVDLAQRAAPVAAVSAPTEAMLPAIASVAYRW